MVLKRTAKLDKFGLRVDGCTLVPLGLLPNFLEKHVVEASGLLIQVLTSLIVPLAEWRSLKYDINYMYKTQFEHQLTKQQPTGGSDSRGLLTGL